MSAAPPEIAIRAEVAETRRAWAWLAAKGVECGVPSEQITRLDHCLDEALANVIAHGGAAARSTTVVLRFELRRAPESCEAKVTVSDSGAAFDPIAFAPAPPPATLAEAAPGGLGLLMMRSYADELSYRFSDRRNQLSFAVRWRERQ